MDDKDRISFQIDIWKKTIDVQQHFNDIALRIRNLFFTLFGAGIAILGYILQRSHDLGAISDRVLLIILLWSQFACLAFWFLDRLWYHRLLQGAVQHAQLVERSLASIVPNISLTHSITAISRQHIGPIPLDATFKLDFFYLSFAAAIASTGIWWNHSPIYAWELFFVMPIIFVFIIIRSIIRQSKRDGVQ